MNKKGCWISIILLFGCILLLFVPVVILPLFVGIVIALLGTGVFVIVKGIIGIISLSSQALKQHYSDSQDIQFNENKVTEQTTNKKSTDRDSWMALIKIGIWFIAFISGFVCGKLGMQYNISNLVLIAILCLSGCLITFFVYLYKTVKEQNQ